MSFKTNVIAQEPTMQTSGKWVYVLANQDMRL